MSVCPANRLRKRTRSLCALAHPWSHWCFRGCRCAAAEIYPAGPRGHQREGLLHVPLRGQRGPFERTGAVSQRTLSSKKGPVALPAVTDRLHPFTFPGAVLRGRLQLQGAAAGGWLHPVPVLAARVPAVSGVEAFPGSQLGALHSIPTHPDRPRG